MGLFFYDIQYLLGLIKIRMCLKICHLDCMTFLTPIFIINPIFILGVVIGNFL